ncbi:MAG: hypothetical protein HN348_06190 [Proteobacteria bacterium]|jgi:hypothetical protein|nr:hypothetical protein [Pseudomonadota bacterium]
MTALILAGVLGLAPALAQEPPRDPIIGQRTPLEEQLETMRAELDDQRLEIESLRQQLQDEQVPDHKVTHKTKKARKKVKDERVSFGSDVFVDAGEEVIEAVSFGSEVRVAGHVLDNATSFGGNVIIVDGGIVDGDAISFGGKVQINPGGVVNGDRVALDLPGFAPNITVEDPQPSKASGFLSSLYHRLFWFLSIAGAGVLVVGLVPRRVGSIATRIGDRPIRSAITGMFASGFLALSAILFAITILGLPISLVLIALLGLAWLMGFVGLCQAVGDRLPFNEKVHGRWLAFLIGALLVTFLGALPWVGFLVVFIAGISGIGAALSTRYGSH